MKRRTFTVLMFLMLCAGTIAAHDLFLKLDSYFVKPGTRLIVRVLNGTFTVSEGSVAKDRVRDITVVSSGGSTRLDTTAWTAEGDTSTLVVHTGESGTYVIGASTRPRELTLSAKEFNAYLAHDGLPDVLEARRKARQLDRPARERYSKHVKAVVQVGDRRTDNFGTPLGYPAELIPLDNPAMLKAGDKLRVRAVVNGQPVANQLIGIGGPLRAQSARTDSGGVAEFRIRAAGVWYIKFIHMERSRADSTIDYESRWATLTFGVR